MTRLLWPLSVLLVCLPVAILATGVSLPFLHRQPGMPQPVPVPSGDQELAWFHTTTSGTTWERFVTGVARAQLLVPGLRVDDSMAFADQTTATPEIVLSMDGRPGRIRIRWYKLTNDATAARWVQALAERGPAPLAVIGGGSTDRAVDLARAMEDQQSWRGDRPLLLITTATADEVPAEADDAGPATRNLIDVYRGRSFRFCFTNRQMAEAVLGYVWENPCLRPRTFAAMAPAAVASGLAACEKVNPIPAEKPHVFSVFWRDDPFSTDLHEQFSLAVQRKLLPAGADPMHAPDGPQAHIATWSVPFSVGGFARPNTSEAEVATSILEPRKSGNGWSSSPGMASRSMPSTGMETWSGQFKPCQYRLSCSATATRSVGTKPERERRPGTNSDRQQRPTMSCTLPKWSEVLWKVVTHLPTTCN